MVLRTRVLVNTSGDQLPIIEVTAQAPDAGRALKLANAAVAGVDDYLGRRASEESVAPNKRMRVSGVGVPELERATRGPGPLLALGASVLTFLLGCGAILLVAQFASEWQFDNEWRLTTDEPPDRDSHSPSSFESVLAMVDDLEKIPTAEREPALFPNPRDPRERP